MNNPGLRILVTTFPDRRQAEDVTRLLVDAGLAVCGQVGADLVSFGKGFLGLLRDYAAGSF